MHFINYLVALALTMQPGIGIVGAYIVSGPEVSRLGPRPLRKEISQLQASGGPEW